MYQPQSRSRCSPVDTLVPRKEMEFVSELERIGHREFFARYGFTVFQNALSLSAINETVARIERHVIPYEGELLRQGNRYESHNRGGDRTPNDPMIINAILNAHRINTDVLADFPDQLLNLVCHPDIAAGLSEIDPRPPFTLHQTLLFFTSPHTALHIDSWGIDTIPPGYAYTVWVPLEDVNIRSGPPYLVPWKVGNLITLEEFGLSLPLETETGTSERESSYHSYNEALEEHVRKQGPDPFTYLAKKGDILVWSSLTPHGSWGSISGGWTRLSVQTLFRPTSLPWGNFIRFIQRDDVYDPGKEEHAFNKSFRIYNVPI